MFNPFKLLKPLFLVSIVLFPMVFMSCAEDSLQQPQSETPPELFDENSYEQGVLSVKFERSVGRTPGSAKGAGHHFRRKGTIGFRLS